MAPFADQAQTLLQIDLPEWVGAREILDLAGAIHEVAWWYDDSAFTDLGPVVTVKMVPQEGVGARIYVHIPRAVSPDSVIGLMSDIHQILDAEKDVTGGELTYHRVLDRDGLEMPSLWEQVFDVAWVDTHGPVLLVDGDLAQDWV